MMIILSEGFMGPKRLDGGVRPTRTGWVLLAAAIVAGIILLSSVLVFAPSLLFGPRSPISGLTASVSADKDGCLPGEPVLITFTVTNAGDAIADVRFGSRCLASYAIRAPDGSAIYDYVSHFACLQAFANFSLRPGVSRSSSCSIRRVKRCTTRRSGGAASKSSRT